MAGCTAGYYLTKSQFFAWIFIVITLISLFLIFFFRDPERQIPADSGAIVSAADGKIIAINRVHEPDYIQGEAIQVVTFLSPLDIHVNRSPVRGRVEWVRISTGAHRPAFSEQAQDNAQNSIGLITESGQKYLIRQIVGALARRILCRVSEGDSLQKGERFGIIQFGSRTDVFMPPDCEVKVSVGDRVKGGETIIGVHQ